MPPSIQPSPPFPFLPPCRGVQPSPLASFDGDGAGYFIPPQYASEDEDAAAAGAAPGPAGITCCNSPLDSLDGMAGNIYLQEGGAEGGQVGKGGRVVG